MILCGNDSGLGQKAGAPSALTDCTTVFLWSPWYHCSVHSQSVSVQVTRDSHTYSVGVCTAAAGLDQGGCKDGGVCLLSGSKGVSFGRLASMQLDYRHEDEAVILSYVNGDICPPGKSLHVTC